MARKKSAKHLAKSTQQQQSSINEYFQRSDGTEAAPTTPAPNGSSDVDLVSLDHENSEDEAVVNDGDADLIDNDDSNVRVSGGEIDADEGAIIKTKGKNTVYRSAQHRAKQAQSTAVKNGSVKQWPRSLTMILVERREEGHGWADIAKNFLGEKKGRHACERKYARLAKTPDGKAIVPDGGDEDEDLDVYDGLSSDPFSSSVAPSSSSTVPNSSQTPEFVPMGASTARLFPQINNEFRAGALFFQQLVDEDFSSYSDLIRDYRNATFYKKSYKKVGSPLSFSALSTLSWNRWLSSLEGEAVGRFRSDDGLTAQPLVYLADKKWTDPEKDEFKATIPRKQLHWCGPFLHWMWKE